MNSIASDMSSQQIAALASLFDVQIADAAIEAAKAAESPPVLPWLEPWRPFDSYRALIVSWVLCLGLTLVNVVVGGLFAPKPKARDPVALVAGLELSAAMDAAVIEAYQAEHGELPWSLAQVGLPDNDPDLEFQRTGETSYRVIVRHGEILGIFDSRLQAQRRAEAGAARAADARRRAAEKEAWNAAAEERLAEFKRGDAEMRRRVREKYAMEGIQ